RNIMDRLPKSMHAQVRRVLRQAWETDDADKAEKLLRNLARRLERDWEGVAASILEGLDEMLTVTKLGLPPELRRSLACTNIIENWTCPCLVESHCPLVSFVFEIYWAFVTKSRMPAHGIIEPVDISGDGIFGLKA